jgi:hypothetical protein
VVHSTAYSLFVEWILLVCNVVAWAAIRVPPDPLVRLVCSAIRNRLWGTSYDIVSEGECVQSAAAPVFLSMVGVTPVVPYEVVSATAVPYETSSATAFDDLVVPLLYAEFVACVDALASLATELFGRPDSCRRLIELKGQYVASNVIEAVNLVAAESPAAVDVIMNSYVSQVESSPMACVLSASGLSPVVSSTASSLVMDLVLLACSAAFSAANLLMDFVLLVYDAVYCAAIRVLPNPLVRVACFIGCGATWAVIWNSSALCAVVSSATLPAWWTVIPSASGVLRVSKVRFKYFGQCLLGFSVSTA